MRGIFLFCLASLAWAQGGTEPKPKAEDYEVHGPSKNAAVGAEYMIHSFSGQGLTFIAKDYLVVEVALYPPKGQTITVNEGAFALRINGKKQTLVPAAPSMVATSLEHPEWQSGPRLEAGGGLGNTGVILGRPNAPQVPGGQQPAPLPRSDRDPDIPVTHVRAEEVVVQTALQEGVHRGPVSGFLYFPYRGKSTSIKSLELLYDDAALKLR